MRARLIIWVLMAALAALALALPVRGGHSQAAPAPPDQSGGGQPAQTGGGSLVLLTRVEGTIGPATARQITDAIAEAESRNADALILQLNTPGGLVTSTRDIIIAILDSKVPVIGYVAPSGAHAASAGTYILYATHAAAMAPATNIGAATPIQMGGGGMPGGPRSPDEGGEQTSDDEPGDEKDKAADKPPPSDNQSKLEAKQVNDAVAFIRGLAEMRGRNADWAEAAVREAATLTADGALQADVVEAVAASVPSLLTQLDGRTVTVGEQERRLALAGARVEEVTPSFMTQVLAVIANPNVAFVLMLVGVYGLIFEFSNPGSIGPGVIGAISLIIGLYALNQLPLDYAGLALVILGIAFMVAEAVSPSFGILGLGGVGAFILGSAMLIDTDQPAYQLSWGVIVASAAVTGGLLMLIVGYAIRSFRSPIRTGPRGLIGAEGDVLDWQGDKGHVWLNGERWTAHTRGAPPKPGQRVRVRKVDGLTLVVEALSPGDEQAINPGTGA